MQTNLDTYDDKYKLLFFGIIILDVIMTILFAKILTCIYFYLSKKALKIQQKNQLLIQANQKEANLNVKLQ